MAEVLSSPQNNDLMNELLIAKLLEDDMRELENLKAAEEVQLNETLATSALAAGRFPKKGKSGVLGRTDHDVVLDVLQAELHANKDALMAQALQHAEDSNMVASRQYAQRLAAAEKKCLLDSEFAKRLQQIIDDGDDDDEDMRDAESILGQDEIDIIMASDMNEKGKGKGQARVPSLGAAPIKKEEKSQQLPDQSTCGICMESFQSTHSPVAAAKSANSSSRLQFGTYLPCPQSHGYCISCLNGYIHSKLDPDGIGAASQSTVVFPIRCPECPVAEWPQGIPDALAERVLSEKGMTLWHHQKLLDSLPRYYCPNPRCSTLVQVDEDAEDPQAICPSCDSVICVPCRVIWHTDLSCEEYQALPLDERSPEDQEALRLIKAKNWRRCPSCSMIVELTHGCNHITCRCKTEFCFKCGALWDVEPNRCSRVPSCDLWDEQLLLEERERIREEEREEGRRVDDYPLRAEVAVVRDLPPPPPYNPHPAPLYNPRPATGAFDWMDDPDILCTRHWFTANMINSLTCQYCDAKLNSIADLRYHLSHVRWHSVYACCGRFFKREEDFERHLDSTFVRFGGHRHTVRRN
ncbi:hypothetical protein L226DRAFT_501257 [Lentinus tigrinus ALCF2SS1-7]|uniref:RBR-type E3 ubiquitin transferase n=1 Tax=Lentinus tigrinus ALCF2SS1-6 TaxID=1328759 RepID=A0A5C2SQT4_9APHY|nr:hypothetical protein L227DRAFT_540639 [Lentinus tigrinus ALCF2SS1-6]RPD78872.1 hypothetical protein L226DRAFT_501257 [Lentinus tigrinus ALCF2SS1-7]